MLHVQIVGDLRHGKITGVNAKGDSKRDFVGLDSASQLGWGVVGYSRLVGIDGAVKQIMETLLIPLVAEHADRLVKLLGDGAIAEFSSVVGAVSCAATLQVKLAKQQDKAAR